MLEIICKVWDRFSAFIAWATHTDRKLARDKPLKREKEIELAETHIRNMRFPG